MTQSYHQTGRTQLEPGRAVGYTGNQRQGLAMTKHRPSRSKLSTRRETMPKTPEGRARLAAARWGRYSSKDALHYLQNPTRETAGWAREGVLTRAVMEGGELSHLKTLVGMGAKFDTIHWNNTDRIEKWSTQATRQWLEVMFENGWNGMGGHPHALLSVAQYHPELVDMWATHVPKTWHTRRNWLDGQLVMTRSMSPERVRAWMGVGASQGNPANLALDPWISRADEETDVVETLVAIHSVMQTEKGRRRVRGEPPFRDWPWAQTMQAAAEHSKIAIVQCLSELHAAPTTDQVITLIARSRQPVEALSQAKQHEWKIPHPSDAKGSVLLSEAILQQARILGLTGDPEAFVFHLLEQGYTGPLSSEAEKHVSSAKCSDGLRCAVEASVLRKFAPACAEPAPVMRRRF